MTIMKSEKWKTKNFIEVQDNPVQRDTPRHAEKSLKRHLSQSSVTHQRVSVAKLGGEYYKLDGHTRAYLWDSRDLPMPDKVNVDVYHVETIKEVKALYHHFDNPSAQETAHDKVYSAMKSIGYTPASKLVRNAGLTSALRHLDPYAKQIDGHFRPRPALMYDWRETIIAIDQFADLNRLRVINFPVPLMMALVLTVAAYKDEALDFWYKYDNAQGLKELDEVDGVFKLTEIIEKAKLQKKISARRNESYELCGKALACFKVWHVDNWVPTGKFPRPLSVNEFRDKANKKLAADYAVWRMKDTPKTEELELVG